MKAKSKYQNCTSPSVFFLSLFSNEDGRVICEFIRDVNSSSFADLGVQTKFSSTPFRLAIVQEKSLNVEKSVLFITSNLNPIRLFAVCRLIQKAIAHNTLE